MLDAACAAAPVTLSIDLRLHVTTMAASFPSSLEKIPDINLLDTPINSPMSEYPPAFQPRTLPGRPDLRAILSEEVNNAAGPVSVDVSGPAALAQTVRTLLREPEIAGGLGVLRGRAPVTLHVETFGM
jgi:ferric-chelate reductase